MTNPAAADLIARSNRLGADPKNTNYAGGNTSAKGTEIDPVTGEPVELLWVKGSGGDLGTLQEKGLAVLRLDRMRSLVNVYPGLEREDEMVAAFDHCLFGKGGAAPSIDTAMHGLVDAAHVDHLHPDSGIAIATAADGEQLTATIFGDKVVWVPWRRPGFQLGLDIAEIKAKNPQAVGCILGGHGITAWGDTSEESEKNSLWIIDTAAAYIAEHGADAPFGAERAGFGALPEATTNGHTIIGQNWDWLAGVHGRCVVLRISRSNGPNLICYTEAGIVGGKMGVNQHGIGLVENGLVSDHDGRNPYEKPFHMRCREILDAETYDLALLPITATRRVCSANFVVGHADGEVIDIETSPDAISYLFPRDGLITHSNHFMDPRHGPSQMERISTSTLYRANRLDRLLRSHTGRIDDTVIKNALADHFGYPNAICRHPDERQPEAKRTMTNAAFIFDLNARTMLVANGPPCETPWELHTLDGGAVEQAAE
mgnify:CR=1 FL=1